MRLPGTRGGTSSDARGGRLRGLFAPKPFLLVLALAVVGLVVGGAVPIVGYLGRFLGIAAAGFALAFLDAARRYLEVALAGTLTAAAGVLLNSLGLAWLPLVADYGVEIAGIGATMGLLAAVTGHYFGRDLRAGLTREV